MTTMKDLAREQKTASCAPAGIACDRRRTCGFAVPDPGGMETDGLLLSAWTEAVFAGETVTAAGLAEAIARHCHARGEPGLARSWMRQGRAHMQGLH